MTYICDICSISLSSKGSCCRHLKTHAQPQYYSDWAKESVCDICSKPFPNKGHCMEHLKHSHGSKPFICDICSQDFAVKFVFWNHIKTHLSETRYKRDVSQKCVCDICFQSFTQKGSCKGHIVTINFRSPIPFICDLCSCVFFQRCELTRHLTRIHGWCVPTFKCQQCKALFKLEKNLKDHKERGCAKLKRAALSYTCDICNQTLSDKSGLLGHFKRHSADRPFTCQECDKSFSRPENLKSHYLSKRHYSRPVMECDLCPKRTPYKHELTTHMELCHGAEQSFQCQKCRKQFRSMQRLRGHMHRHDPNELICDVCSATYLTNMGLAAHFQKHSRLKSNISNYRPLAINADQDHACDICGKRFSVKRRLVPHFETHVVWRRFKCVPCNKLFASQTHLNIHASKIHSGIHKRFICDICPRSYGCKVALSAHMDMHRSGPLFECSHCTASFRMRCILREHILLTHSGEEQMCDICSKTIAGKRLDITNHLATHPSSDIYGQQRKKPKKLV